MTLRNEIFEGLAAAKASKDLIYDPKEDYYQEAVIAARRKNRQDAETDRKTAEAKAAGGGMGVPQVPTVASTTAIPGGVPGVPPPVGGGPMQGAGVPPLTAIDLGAWPNSSWNAARGGSIRKFRKGGKVRAAPFKAGRAIYTNYRAGGPVTPDEAKQGPDYNLRREPELMPSEDEVPSKERYGPNDPWMVRGPWKDSDSWDNSQNSDEYEPDEDEDDEEPDRVSPRHPQLRYQAGGSVDDDQSEADLIFQSIMGREQGEMARNALRMRGDASTRDAINQSVPPPPVDQNIGRDVDAASAFRRREMQSATNRQLPEPPPHPRAAPSALTIPRSSGERAISRAAPYVPDYIDPDAPPGSSLLHPAPDTTTDYIDPQSQAAVDKRWREDKLERELKANPSVFTPQTPEEVEQSKDELEQIRKERAEGSPSKQLEDRRRKAMETGAPKVTAEATGTNATPDVKPNTTTAAATAATGPRPAGTGTVIDPATPTPPPATRMPPPPSFAGAGPDIVGANSEVGRFNNPNQVPVPPAKGGPPPNAAQTGGSGTHGPGGGNAASAAPPTTARAPEPGYSSDPNKAYDPVAAGRVNPDGTFRYAMNTGAPPSPTTAVAAAPSVGGGRPDLSTNNAAADYANLPKVLAGAGTVAGGQPPYVGHRMLSPQNYQTLVSTFNDGGRLTNGNAAIRGMLAGYYSRLEQGRPEEANKLAYGIIQAANLHASAYGSAGLDALRRGDYAAAARALESGLDNIPDGMNHNISADGRSVESRDAKGNVTSRIPLDGRWVLQALTGMKDGTLMWQTLQAAAAQITKTNDKDPEGRMLQHLIRQQQLEGLKLRNAKARAGAGPAAPLSPAAQAARDALARAGGVRRSGEEGGGGGGGYNGPSAEDIAHERALDADPSDNSDGPV